MKKGDITTVKIERTRYPGKGIGPIQDGGTAIPCAVKGAVPGQILKVRISKKRKGKAEGKLLEVLALAPDAVTPVCPMFGRCGGCTYQSTAYPPQLAMKDGWVMTLLAEAGITGFEHLPALPSPEIYGYRNKMEFSFGDDCPGGPLMLGLHEKNHFYNIVPVQDCVLAHPDFGAIVTAVLDYFRSRGAQAFHKRAHTGFLRYLVVRRGAATGEIMVNLVTTSQGTLDDAAFVQALEHLPLVGSLITVIHSVYDGVADVARADTSRMLLGEGIIHDTILGIDFAVSPFSFLQTNTRGAETLYTAVRRTVIAGTERRGSGKKPAVFDLYCGVGTIAQVLAPIAEHVTGIELVPEAVNAARANAAANGLTNCTFIAGDVKAEVGKLAEAPEVIVLDPPREGVHPKALPDILAFAPACFVYVSCKASSLARDLPAFVAAGYRVETVQCVDMFPQTPHVETVVLLSKLDVDKHINVEIKLDELDLTSAESKATYKQIQNYVLEKFGFKISTLYIAQVKKKHGLEVREHYNISKNENQKVPQCPIEKEEAILDTLKYYKMI